MRYVSTAVRAFEAIFIGVAVLTAAEAHAQRPVWQALPDETLAVARVPAPREFYEALHTRTKLGAVAFEPRRIEAVKEVLVADAKEDLDAVAARFAKLDLTLEDLLPLADGELGAAVVMLPREGKEPTIGFVLWSECGEPAAEKYLAALEKGLEAEAKGEHPLRREDLEIAGRQVRHFLKPKFVAPHNALQLGLGVKNGVPNGKFDVKEAPGDAQKKNARNGYSHLLLCRSETTLLALFTDPAGVAGEMPADAAVEEEGRRGGDEARGLLARILEERQGTAEGVVERWLKTPGMAATLPEGVPAVEFAADLKRVTAFYDRPESQEAWKMVRALGLADVGPAAYRMTLDGTTLRSGFFLSAPQPRQGLLALMDQTPIAPAPADWVSGDVVGYQHISFDLGKAYKQIAQIVRDNSHKGGESIAQIEAQTQQFLQVDVGALLSSLGTKHVILSFPPAAPNKVVKAAEEETAQNAMALVWRVADEPLWKRLMGTAALMAGQPVKEEQGFSGLRHDTPEFHGGWFLGDGNMVLAFGQGVTERTLAMLRNPPRTADSLAGGPLARRAAELVPQQPAWTYDITNGPTALRLLNEAVLATFAESKDPSVAKLKDAWPSQDELEGVIGVSAAVTEADADGLKHLSVSDLPAP